MIQEIRSTLLRYAQSTPPSKGVYFKTGPLDYAYHDKFIGVKVPDLREISKKYLDLEHSHILELLNSTVNEERFLALIILVHQYKKSPESTYDFYIENLKCINNWNLVDASAHLIIGAHLLDKDKSFLNTLARSEIMWERRIAIVSTWYFIKKDLLEWTFSLSQTLMQDKHDLIHKACGWMLREAGKKDTAALVRFLDHHTLNMPRTMLRYAIEKFPQDVRQGYLKAK